MFGTIWLASLYAFLIQKRPCKSFSHRNIPKFGEMTYWYHSAIATPASDHLKTELIAVFDSTRLQSDSVRQLFAPLTSPLELSMLSEMYSPTAPTVSSAPSPSHARGSSASILRSPSSHVPIFSKRSTWNGAARARRVRAISELDRDPGRPHSPPSPSVASFVSEVPNDTFGSFALGIARSRRITAKALRDLVPDLLERPYSPLKQPSRPSSTQSRRPHSPLTSPASPPSRHDSARSSPRRPRSYSSLMGSLDRAVMSRRYAASHLLALRFDEGSSDVYWEDVASVMKLFSKALLDASSSLAEALNQYLVARMAEQVPTPPSKIKHSSDVRGNGLQDIFGMPISPLPSPPAVIRRLPSVELSSFAPMPTDLAQFAAHMDAMARSIEAAQKELRACLTALQSPPPSRDDQKRATRDRNDLSVSRTDPLTQQVMDSYARLRRELGIALRECERSKVPLTSALHINTPRGRDNGDEDAGPPPSGVEAPSNETTPISPALSNSSLPYTAELESGVDNTTQAMLNADVFDDFINSKWLENEKAGAGPLLGGSGKNPFAQPDPEQVYEATIPPATVQLREKSKLSRAERIRQMRERRAAGGATVLSDIPGSSSDERASEKNGKSGRGQLGPGGDVVLELKSVINLVSEKRRGGGSSTSLTTTSSPLSRSQSTRSPSPQPPAELPPQPTPVPSGEQENEPAVRSRTSSAGTTRASKPTRPPPPPTDGFDTDTFGPRENRSSSPSLPSSPSPPGSPPFPHTLELPPSTYVTASSSPIPTAPASPLSQSSLPNRVSTLLAAMPRPPRPNRPNRQLPAVPVGAATAPIQS